MFDRLSFGRASHVDVDNSEAAPGDAGPLATLYLLEERGRPIQSDLSLTMAQAAAQITRSGLSWAPGLGQAATVSYAYRQSAATMPGDTLGFFKFNAQQIAATELALRAWSDVANITFNRVQDAGSEYSNNATLLFGGYGQGEDGAAAFAYLPGSTDPGANAGDVWVNNSLSYNATPTRLGYGELTLVHEIGHAIGLSHPGNYNAGQGGTISGAYFEDSLQYTVMSYFGERTSGGDFRLNGGTQYYASTPLMDDIAAVQRLYGANMTTRTGDTVYGFNSNADRPWFTVTAGQPFIFCVWDAGGVDTLDFSGLAQSGTIDLRQGAFSSLAGMVGNVSIAVGSVIENVIGSVHRDVIRGNSADNRIESRGGSDSIDGGLGVDTLVLSEARAYYTFHWANGIYYMQGPGEQAILVSVTNVEFLQFTDQTVALVPEAGLKVTGDVTDDTAVGTQWGDTIAGVGGDDQIDGGAGDDVLTGDVGEDLLTGGLGADRLTGGAGDDVLTGGDGDDIVDGGTGLDQIDGGAGIDWIALSGDGTRVVVDLTLGTATQSGITETLTGFEGFGGGAGDDLMIGDGSANVLSGGAGVDRLEGRGGDDRLTAGAGRNVGAPEILKTQAQANASIGTAVAISAFDLSSRPEDIANSTTIPHATVKATAHGGLEYYAVTAAAGETLRFDIDGATFDSTLRIVNANGVQIAANDDSATDSGLAGTDSGLNWTFTTAGTYYIQIGEWVSNTAEGFVSQGAAAGQSYVLHVSSPNATPTPIVRTGSTVDGGDGDDWIISESGVDTLIGGAGDDRFTISNGGGSIDGGAGLDTVGIAANRSQVSFTVVNGVTMVHGVALTGIERVHLRDGVYDVNGVLLDVTNVMNGSAFGENMQGSGGADIMDGRGGDDTMNGNAGNDRIIDGLGDDYILGGEGDDVIVAGLGNDTIDGGTGLDVMVFSGTRASYEVNTSGTITVASASGVDRVQNVERLQFSDITLRTGYQAGQYIEGTAGNDTLSGTGLRDELVGAGGNDILFGLNNTDSLEGGDGDDVLTGGEGEDYLNGGAGVDTAVYAGPRSAYTLTPFSGFVRIFGPNGTDDLYGIEQLRFSDGLYDITGAPIQSEIVGTPGADTLNGGVGVDVISGGAGDDVITGAGGNDQIDGGAGTDTAVFSGAMTGSTITTSGGVTTVSGPDGVDALTNVERLRFSDGTLIVGAGGGQYFSGGAAGDTLNGTGFSDRIEGLGGSDTLNGLVGDDVLVGGAGADTLNGGDGVDTVDYSGAAAGVTARLDLGTASNDGDGGSDTLANIENLTGSAFNDTLFGNAGANVLTGGEGRDTLLGLGGNDTLVGGAGVANELYGGAGDDLYVVSNRTDTVVENAGEGTDTVQTDQFQLNLSANVENLTYTGTGTFTGVGNALANVIRGGTQRDALIGGGGNDTLYGGTGAANELYGGAGDDVFVLDAADSVIEGAGDGTDTVRLRDLRNHTLGANVENGEAIGTGDYALTGNALNNSLTGGAGNDVLQGRGGIDTLNGGLGTDTASYILSAAGVTARLDLGRASNDGEGGTDTFVSIENLVGSNLRDTLFGDSGNNVIDGAIGDDVLLGLSGDDVLIGGSGGGNNEMYGGLGDDLYIVDALDTLIENAAEGIDSVRTTMGNFTLKANIENLTYVGPGNFGGTGNAEANILTGAQGHDTLSGLGGDDTLNGGAGQDTAQLRGVRADYLVEAIEGGYRVTDSTAGRDGVDLLYGMEQLRFSDGSVLMLGTPGAAPAAEVMPRLTDKAGDAFVLPALEDDRPLVLPFAAADKGDAEPMVLPGLDGGKLAGAFQWLADDALVAHGPHGPMVMLPDDAARDGWAF